MSVREMLGEMFTSANASTEGQQRFLQGIRDAQWLLDDKLVMMI